MMVTKTQKLILSNDCHNSERLLAKALERPQQKFQPKQCKSDYNFKNRLNCNI